jgi:hypothetical protein
MESCGGPILELVEKAVSTRSSPVTRQPRQPGLLAEGGVASGVDGGEHGPDVVVVPIADRHEALDETL